jgi:putative endonuclease
MAATMSARRDTVWTNASDAIAVERQIKGWSRAKKEALIRGDYDAIKLLSKRSHRKPSA